MSKRATTASSGAASDLATIAKDSVASASHSLRQFADHKGHFSLVRNFHLADALTIMNGVCGVSSIFAAARYLVDPTDTFQIYAALALPAAGFVFDALDGKVARWRKSSSMLGQELDSLADLISFGVAPAFLAFALGLRTTLDTAALTAFVCAGLARLARFNATVASIPKDATGKSKYFEGLPIPSTLGLVSYLAYLVWTKQTGNDLPFGTLSLLPGGGGDLHKLTLVYAAWAAAMVSKTLKVPKL